MSASCRVRQAARARPPREERLVFERLPPARAPAPEPEERRPLRPYVLAERRAGLEVEISLMQAAEPIAA
jgi:hypothetical protein